MPKSSPNMHVNQEVSTRVKSRLLCKQSMGQNTPNKIDDDGSKSHQGLAGSGAGATTGGGTAICLPDLKPSAPSNLSDSKWRLLSLAEIAYSGWSFASLTPLRKVEKGPQLLVVFVVVATLPEEHMACLDQQHSRREGQAVVAAIVVVEDLLISDLDDSSNLDSWKQRTPSPIKHKGKDIIQYPINTKPLILQFTAVFHNDMDMIEVSSFYHRQWAPEYPEFVNFKYDGTTYQIRLRQHRAKVYFAEGLNKFRKDLSIFESMIIKFLACNNKSMFDLYFIPSLECKTCGRPQLMSRQHIWTLEITQSMLGAPGPLRLPYCAITHANACSQQMTILRRFGPPLQWNVVVVDNGVARRYVVQPWYQFLADNDFSHGDEVSFYYRSIDKIWEIGPSNWLAPIQFSATFRVSKNIIEVPLSYHRQWRPYYPTYYNGTTYFVRLRKYGSRYFFFDGLKQFRRTHGIDDSVIMRFFAADKNTSFEVDVIGPILRQGRPRSVLPPASSFQFFVWITKSDSCSKRLWQTQPMADSPCTMVSHLLPSHSSNISENNLMVGDEVIFFFRFDEHLLTVSILWRFPVVVHFGLSSGGTTKLYNSDRLMAHIADKIKTIDGSKETLKLAVRITELWFVGTSSRSEQAEMVIIDSDGDQIHLVCKQDQLKRWKMDLKEDCTYVMHNFKVNKNDGHYRVCDHPYKLAFIGVMIVRQWQLDKLPFKNYRFADFPDVIVGQLQSDLLVDVIGVVDEVVFRHISPKRSYPCSVSNSLKASKLTINQPVAPIEEFNLKLSELGIEIHSVLTRRSQWSSQPSSSPQLSSKETFILKSEAKTISEINNLCECHKKTNVYTEPFVCPCGRHNDRVVLRYRVEVMVNYKDESTKFLLWDHECTELIGQSADEVNTLKVEDGDLDLNVSPKALDKLLGHLLAFKIKIQPQIVSMQVSIQLHPILKIIITNQRHHRIVSMQLSIGLHTMLKIIVELPFIKKPAIMQFRTTFHNDRLIYYNFTCNIFLQDIIKVPFFYHIQWAPKYPKYVRLKYNGVVYQIQVRLHKGKIFFVEGLKQFRKELAIYESTIIYFFAIDHISVFDLHFSPPLEQQTSGRPWMISRQHILTLEIIQSMIDASHPLVMITKSLL
ncbi:hypothetical protein HKD37_05G013009 [Glycine soja]